MPGIPTAYARLPYLYSDQYDLSMEYAGLATHWDQVIVRGNLTTRKFLAFWLKDQRVIAGMNTNIWNMIQPIQTLIRSGRPVDPKHLADPSIAFDDQLAHQP